MSTEELATVPVQQEQSQPAENMDTEVAPQSAKPDETESVEMAETESVEMTETASKEESEPKEESVAKEESEAKEEAESDVVKEETTDGTKNTPEEKEENGSDVVAEEKPVEQEKKPAEQEKEDAIPEDPKSTPQVVARRGRGRPTKGTETPVATPTISAVRGRKRRGSEAPETPSASGVKSVKRTKRAAALAYTDFIDWPVGARVLTCGEGDQLGHPGRSTTKKPRKVDIVEEDGLKIAQVVAGGVHSVLLTDEGVVYSCGINEKGTVPAEGVEPEGSIDEFTKIVFAEEIVAAGKIVMLTAGASFTAALTDKGSVIAWGNLRDASGKIDVHQQLTQMQEKPIIIVHHKKDTVVVKIVAGENHLVMLTEDGRVLTFGDCSMGQLGRSQRVSTMRSQYMAADSSLSLLVHLAETRGRKKIFVKNIFAGGFWTAMLTEDDRVFVCGLNNFGQLGIADQHTDEAEEKDTEVGGAAGDAEQPDKELRIFLPRLSDALSGKHWTHMEGVQHIIARTADGELYAIGKNTDNALGLDTWSGNDDLEHWRYDTLQKLDVAGKTVTGVSAKLGSSIAWVDEGSAYSWGCDTSGQLGLGIKDDDEKVVPKPELVSSAHLDGYKIVQISMADNHSMLLATKTN